MHYDKNLIRSVVSTHMNMQATLNDRMAPSWRENPPHFLAALVVEAGELLEHLAYKWWKASTINVEQAQGEVIDIYHFLLSHIHISGEDVFRLEIEALEKSLSHLNLQAESDPSLISVEHRTATVLALLSALFQNNGTVFQTFFALAASVGLTLNDVSEKYLAKNTLNLFRQDHGDRSGSYPRIWAGREDNEHLTELMTDLDFLDPKVVDTLTNRISSRYSELCT